MSQTMPVLFVGHGSPMNVVADNAWTRAWRVLGAEMPRPRAILAVSAHWAPDATLVTAMERPRTIHDFGGFPDALYQIEYPAAGSPSLAKRISALLEGHSSPDHSWGLDHGTWCVLAHVYPDADIPVVQLSIDVRLSMAQHIDLGRWLAPFRDEGVLIVGSGNITHNLRDWMARRSAGDPSTPSWATAFEDTVVDIVGRNDPAALAALGESPAARLSHPYPDHFWPLLYAMGAADDYDAVSFPVTGFDGSISMRSVRWDRG